LDVAIWLSGLGLEQYEEAFRENDIDAEVLRELTAEDLVALGVTSIGHRRKLLAAIAALREAPPATDANERPAGVAPTRAERRQLTVMFCDLVGSTALSTQFDPEDLRDVLAAYHHAVAAAIAESDGFIARYMGDGVLVYFGFPRAHEDDAERAVRAGLRAVDAVSCIEVNSVRLQARVGIATGLVVVGELLGVGSAQEQSIVGETPNLAARLQALAEPDTVVIAASTLRLVGTLFEYRDLGAVELKGIGAAVPAWQVLRPSIVASRFEALRGTALTRLVGRDEEMDLLLRRWTRAKQGDGQVVLVCGEEGLGKSRIAAALRERLETENALHMRYFCSPYHQDSPLFPIVDQLGRAAGFAREDSPATKLEKLRALVHGAEPQPGDFALIADLLSLPLPEDDALPDLSPQRKKERTLEALLRQIEGLARRQPLLMVFEDAHWSDPTSRELLDLTVARVRTLPALLVVTFRPEFQPPWTGQPQVSMLVLNRLDRRDRTALAMQVAGGKAFPSEVIEQIVDRTDGVPLFVEELAKSVLESGLLREEADRYVLDRSLPPFAIPTTLHDSLMARLDRLASVRLVAQIGAAIGREFSYALLHAVSGLDEAELQSALSRLVASELVFQRGTPPDAVYAFKHVLVQDAAHASLLRNARQPLHARIAAALESQFPELMDNHPELLAQHYAEAGITEKSIACWGKAGRRSVSRSAMAEAAAQLHKGLDQLALMPEGPHRHRQELEFWSALGTVLFALKGQAAPETGRAYAKARELWELLGSPPEFLQAPYGESRYHVFRGELDQARRLDESLLQLSSRRNDPAGLVLGHFSSGRNLMFAGRFASSRWHLEQVLTLHNPVSDSSLAQQTGIYPHVNSQGLLGIVLFCLGFPDQALARGRAAVAEARRLAHLPSLAASLTNGTTVLSLLGDNTALDDWTDQVVAVTTEQGFAVWRAQGTIFRGWLKVKNGEVTEGLALLDSGSSAYRTTGAEAWMPHYFALLAAAREIAGQIDEAASLCGEALQVVEKTGQRWLAAELTRLQGRLLLRQGDGESAERLYRDALRISHEQGAKLWELRAAVSLARLLRERCRYAEACDVLAPIYDWFTEGFGTQDLKGAKALLDELS
jgi:class 3 adenylate cyclase/predicted ATPase